jgi:two-component system phosphate regulon sensor histidine kinase PhoR
MALFDRREFGQEYTHIDLHEVIRKSVESVRLQLEKRQGTVILDLAAASSVIQADEIQLMNCILNLLDNANKYSAERPEINVYTRMHEKEIIFGVSDKGIGMTKEMQKRIFEKFYRIPTGNIHTVKGFGLGLSYVKAIIDALHGKIQVWSEPGNGTKIEITLPLPKEVRNTTSHES